MTLDEQIKSNENDPYFKLSNGLSYGGLSIALLFLSPILFNDNTNHDYVGLLIRTAASLAIFYQSDYYRKRIFILLPKPRYIFLFAAFSGSLYLTCIAFIIYSSTTWLFIFGVMMFILFSQNLITFILLRKIDRFNPLVSKFKHWAIASLGYFCVIILISPFIYTILLSGITDITIPLFELKIPYYIDIAPGLILFFSMGISVARLGDKIKDIKEEMEIYYASQNKKE